MTGYRPLGSGSAGASGIAAAVATPVASGYWAALTPFAGSRAALSLTLTRPLLTPVYFAEATSIDRFAIEVTTGGTAGSVVRVGLYTDVGGIPTALVAGSEQTFDTTTTGVKEATVDLALSADKYWVCAVSQVAACSVVGSNAGNGLAGIVATSANAVNTAVYPAARATAAAGALEATLSGFNPDQTRFAVVAARFA